MNGIGYLPVESNEVWLALDLEKAGPRPQHSPISVGMVVGNAYDDVLYMNRIDIKCGKAETDTDPDTMSWWLNHHASMWESLQGPDALDVEPAFQRLREELETVYKSYTNVYLVTTCPSFDIGQLDWYDTKYNPTSKGIRYSLSGRRYLDMNPAERLAALPIAMQMHIRKQLKEESRLAPVQRHDPVYDALYAYRMVMKLPKHAQRPRPHS